MGKRHRKKPVPMNMSREIKDDLLPRLRERYAGRGRAGRGRMLDELCADYGYERKYAIKLLLGRLPSPTGRQKPGPPTQYDLIEPMVRTIWQTAEQPCGKRLQPALRLWLPHYERRHGRLSPRQRELLKAVSAATLDRLLAPARAADPSRGLCGTRPGSLLRTEIPIRTDNWDITRPGFLEADTVAHCGGSLAGDFVWSATFTDIFSAWTEGRAVWNKGATGVVAAVECVERHLPFALLGFDTDNGSEFLNHHLRDHFALRAKPVGFTRSRPYHKDDNAHVEQKNWMWPRQLLGYGRLARAELVEPINELYREAWGPLMNFFLPGLKLERKWREGSHWRKRYEKAQTAYQRLMASGELSRQARAQLRDRYESLDPFALKQEVEKRLKKILAAAEDAARPSGGSAPRGGAGAPPAALHRPKGALPQEIDSCCKMQKRETNQSQR
jgi:hypothetical protein